MTAAPIPDFLVNSIFELTPTALKKRGIKLLFLDLDNTLSPYGAEDPSIELTAWARRLEKEGIEPFILSNNRSGRPRIFAEKMEVGYMGRAKKPSPRKLLLILKEKGIVKPEAALAGDQIFTDIWCAKRAGVLAVAVKPLDLKNPFRAIRYAVEAPFRAMMVNKKVF